MIYIFNEVLTLRHVRGLAVHLSKYLNKIDLKYRAIFNKIQQYVNNILTIFNITSSNASG